MACPDPARYRHVADRPSSNLTMPRLRLKHVRPMVHGTDVDRGGLRPRLSPRGRQGLNRPHPPDRLLAERPRGASYPLPRGGDWVEPTGLHAAQHFGNGRPVTAPLRRAGPGWSGNQPAMSVLIDAPVGGRPRFRENVGQPEGVAGSIRSASRGDSWQPLRSWMDVRSQWQGCPRSPALGFAGSPSATTELTGELFGRQRAQHLLLGGSPPRWRSNGNAPVRLCVQ
jgi:hypothetical protein